ncbi:MAG: hypothetical protein KY431_03845 [Actinobacteria bacterium]|nr:hypothetical protein [Actinomycetota bacterium]
MPIVRRGSCCPRCSAPLVEISFLQAGSTMNMRSCATCHSRSWFRDDVAVDLEAVLAAMSSDRPAGRQRGV